MSASVLYLSYTGLLEPLGRSQVLAYLLQLAKGHQITIVSFEKAADLANQGAVAEVHRICSARGINWRPMRYHKYPRLLATSWDLIAMFCTALWLSRRQKCLVHARSYIPAFIALALRYTRGAPFIFDMRAFWPDEMVSANRLRKNSVIYKALKFLEHRCILEADAVVTLTEAAAQHLHDQAVYKQLEFHVIPTCADLDAFRPELPPQQVYASGASAPFVLGCIGTVNSGWFKIDWLMAFYKALVELKPNAVLRIVSRDEPSVLLNAARQVGLATDRIEISTRPHDDMPAVIRGMDAGAMFFVADFSKLGSCPTRMGEILGCGVPCVANPGVGDVGEIIERYNVGVLVEDDHFLAMRSAAQCLLEILEEPSLKKRCRNAAETWFSLELGVERYDAIYCAIAGAGHASNSE